MSAPAPTQALAGGFTRRGACPALSAPMLTGDGLLVRLNPAAGGLTPEAVIGLCDAAELHGNGVVEVTARGSVQIRGLTETSATLFAQAVDRIGIAARTGVPVQTSALAGLDPDEIADPTKLAEEIRAGIAAAGLEARLGPKVSVVIDGGGTSALDEVAADVRLTAARSAAGAPAWQVAISGDALTARSLGVADGEAAACEAALTLLSAIAGMGRQARGRDLNGDACERLLSPLVGEMSGRTEGGATELGLIGSFQLRGGKHALGVALPFGNTTANTLKTFAKTAQSIGISDLRPAPKRTLVAICDTARQAETLQKSAEMLAFITAPDDPRHSVSACPGAPDCASGHIPARRIAAQIANEFSTLLDGSFRLHVSGCAKGCAHPGSTELVLVGSAGATGLVANGTARDEPLAFAESDGAGRGFADLARLVSAQRLAHETTAQTIQRLGLSALAEAFGRRDT